MQAIREDEEAAEASGVGALRLVTFIGGVGTLHGPVLGAVLYVVLEEYVALRWVDFHLLIFGALFIAIVLLLPGGLVQAAERARRLVIRGA